MPDQWPPPPGPGQPPDEGQQRHPAPWGAPAPPPAGLVSAPGRTVYRPGAIPLRPLGLGDLYDAAFRIIRYNPGATVGAALLVSAVSMVIPIGVTALLTLGLGIAISFEMDPAASPAEALPGLTAGLATLGLSGAAQSLGLVLVTGMVAHVSFAAAIGRRLSLGQAWEATRGRRWRLVGSALLLTVGFVLVSLAALAALVGLVLGVDSAAAIGPLVLVWAAGFLALLCWLWIRLYYLAVPPLMLERRGILGAIGRGFRLTSRSFWRVFGIALLTTLVSIVATVMVSLPIGFGFEAALAAAGSSGAGPLATVVVDSLSQVLVSAFVAPFGAAVSSLLYLDLRIRKEAYDVELLTRAGIGGP